MKPIENALRDIREAARLAASGYGPPVTIGALRPVRQAIPMYPPTLDASNGCSVKGCDRLNAGYRCVNGHWHGDLCGDHSAAETALGR
jgi:hypothetical protein